MDKLTEVAKQLGQTKRNSEAALRRFAAMHPKIERVRDVFDETIPFEMEFDTDPQDNIFNLDLYFNKPPPLKGCNGRFTIPCERFEVGPGDHLIQVSANYKPQSVVVFRDNIRVYAEFGEYEPANGLVWVQATENPITVFNICYIRDTWVECSSLDVYPATVFSAELLSDGVEDQPKLIYTLDRSYDSLVAEFGADFWNVTTNEYASAYVTTPLVFTDQSITIGLNPHYPDLEDPDRYPRYDNIILKWGCSIEGSSPFAGLGNGEMIATVGWQGFGIQWKFYLGRAGPFFPEPAGFYIQAGSSEFEYISSATSGVVTVDHNWETDETIVTGPGGSQTRTPAGHSLSYSPSLVFDVDMDSANPGLFWTSALLNFFEASCSDKPLGSING